MDSHSSIPASTEPSLRATICCKVKQKKMQAGKCYFLFNQRQNPAVNFELTIKSGFSIAGSITGSDF